MRVSLTWLLLGLLSATLWAQTPAKPARKTQTRKAAQSAASKPPAVTQEDLNSLREALAAAQQQIRQLQQEVQVRQQETQQQLQQAQAAATEAQAKLAALETTANERKTATEALQTDVDTVKQNLTNMAATTQEEQKKFSALEGLVSRFRFSGDVRVRQEDFFQSYSGCPNCNPRIRERIRLRFGVEGKLSDDFQAGIFVASGAVTDPTTTNETLTNSFERKTIAFDRGYITYAPKAHPWLQLTGGKFAFTWIRSPQTFDNDLNPEGFSQKLSFDIKNPYFKNVTFTGMQLLFNEVAAPTAATSSSCVPGSEFCANGANKTGADSYAVGGQVSSRIQVNQRLTITPSYSLLNWRNENTLLNQSASVTGNTTITAVAGTPTSSNPNPPNTVTFTNAPFAPNGLTNATVKVGTSANGATILAFVSRFLYSDFILDSTVNTGMAKWPARLTLEYLNNLNAVKAVSFVGTQSHLYKAEATFGQLKNRNDLQFSYGFWRQEQDSVIGAFNESDQRAPTNIVQHLITAQWQVRNNITTGYSLWIGRTLNSNLVNARLAPGLVAGQVEPYLKRMQFDIVYKF